MISSSSVPWLCMIFSGFAYRKMGFWTRAPEGPLRKEEHKGKNVYHHDYKKRPSILLQLAPDQNNFFDKFWSRSKTRAAPHKETLEDWHASYLKRHSVHLVFWRVSISMCPVVAWKLSSLKALQLCHRDRRRWSAPSLVLIEWHAWNGLWYVASGCYSLVLFFFCFISDYWAKGILSVIRVLHHCRLWLQIYRYMESYDIWNGSGDNSCKGQRSNNFRLPPH